MEFFKSIIPDVNSIVPLWTIVDNACRESSCYLNQNQNTNIHYKNNALPAQPTLSQQQLTSLSQSLSPIPQTITAQNYEYSYNPQQRQNLKPEQQAVQSKDLRVESFLFNYCHFKNFWINNYILKTRYTIVNLFYYYFYFECNYYSFLFYF